jgi:hypothetical protein
MQTQPGRFTQLFLIMLGLGMLIFAVVLNHNHPRNAGVATVTHSSINILALDIRQIVPKTDSPLADGSKPIKISPASSYAGSTVIARNQPSRSNSITEAVAGQATGPQDRCSKLDNESFKQVKKTVDESYQTYLSDKQMGQTSDSYYQVYLRTLDSAYSSYKFQLVNQGCQPLQPAPAAQPR